MLSSHNPFSAHKDVLEAPIPSDSIGRTVLLTELKNRAKAAVCANQWPDAQSLYEKAISICQEGSLKEESAICHSNLSLVLGKMNRWDEAKQAALTATQQDESYLKGFWRLGSACAALKEYEDALKALDKVKSQEPNNKALAKEVERIQIEQQKQEQLQAASTASISTAVTTKTTIAPPRSELPKSSAASMSSSSTATAAATDVTMDDDGNLFTKSEVTRGYKIVNGKKTSYFHNELDEHTKQLIGDIAPKKLEAESGSAATNATTNNSDSNTDTIGSAWNQAGTWEEKEISKWACDTLQQALLAAKYCDDGLGLVATVTKADVSGSASVAMVRGKKRYIYELSATVHWNVSGASTTTAHGSMTFPDIDGTCMVGEPYDVTGFKIESASTTAADATNLHAIVCKGGLRMELHQAIDGWVDLLKETY
jgi:tetratricopeptide (TPR) repeat protein